jgi:hypothetical protein
MLLVIRIAAKNFLDQIAELTKIRSNWDPTYAAELLNRIETLASSLLGSKKVSLFEATDNLQKLMVPARSDLSSLKIQIDSDYKKDPVKHKIILDELGFTNYYGKTNSQVYMIGLLSMFAAKIGTYKAELESNGVHPELIDRITGYAKQMTDANIIQEQLKMTGKEATAGRAAQLNDLYDEISTICKLAANYFKDDPLRKEMFTIKKIINNLGTSRPAEAPQTTANA